jgi:hypothetical protein
MATRMKTKKSSDTYNCRLSSNGYGDATSRLPRRVADPQPSSKFSVGAPIHAPAAIPGIPARERAFRGLGVGV